eukprot:Nk52_evm5s304 gene=Nk52_evmTU5s304
MVFQSDFQFYENGALRTEAKVCRDHYYKTFFKLDALSVFPTDVFCFIFADKWQALALLRLNRIIRVIKIPQYFGEKEADIKKSTTKIRLFKFALLVTLLTHWITCCWYFLSCRDGNEDCKLASWGNSNGLDFNGGAGLFNRYIAALYWTVTTTTTTGYGDISAVTTEEKWLSVIFMLVGVVMYGFILGSLASILSNRDVQAFLYSDRLHIRSEYMKELGIPDAVKKRITGYYRYVWLRNKGRDRNTLFSGMPLTFQAEISLSINDQMLNRIPLFKQTDLGFLRMLSLVIKPYLYLPGEVIIHEEDIGRELLYVARGKIQIYKEEASGPRILATMSKGGFIGETCMAFSTARSASVRAISHCDIFVLTKKDIEKVLHHYPEIGESILALSNRKFKYAETHVHDNIMKRVKASKSQQLRKMHEKDSSSLMGFVKKCSRKVSQLMQTHSKTSFRRAASNSSISSVLKKADKGSKVVDVPMDERKSTVSFEEANAVEQGIRQSTASLRRHSILSMTDEEYEATQLIGVRKASRSSRPRYSISLNSSSTTSIHQRKKSTISAQEVENENVENPLLLYSEEDVEEDAPNENDNGSLLNTIISPDSLFFQRWGFFIAFINCTQAILISFQASFAQDNVALFVTTYLFDFLFAMDICLKFRTAYKDKNGHIIADKSMIALRYLKHTFWIDFASIIPLEFISLAGKSTSDQLRFLSYLRLNRLIRVYRVGRLFSRIDDTLGSNKALIRTAKFLIYIILLTHVSGCGYHMIACPDNLDCATSTWLEANSLDGSSVLSRYIASIYWATATTTSTGYGDIKPEGTLERVYAIVIMIIGLLLYGTILATVAATIANQDIERTHFGGKFDAIKQFMDDTHMTPGMRGRIVDYYEYLWARSKGIDLKTLFDDIPSTLQLELTMHVNSKCFESVPLFKNSEIAYIRQLSLKIKPHLFMPNEYILHRGDMGREMYFILKGHAEVLGNDDETEIATLGPGSYFGEISLVFSVPRTASIRAQSYCDVLMLTKDDFDHVLEHFAGIKKEIEEIAMNREYIENVKRAIATLSEEKKSSLAGQSRSTDSEARDTVDDETLNFVRASIAVSSNSSGGATALARASLSAASPAEQKLLQESLKKDLEDTKLEKEELTKASSSSLSRIKSSMSQLGFGFKEDKRKVTIQSSLGRNKLRFLKLSKAERFFSRFLMKQSVMPHSNFISTWEMIALVLSSIITYTVSFQAAFGHDILALWIINYLIDVFFLLDIYLKFHLAFNNEVGALITNPIATAKNYVKGNFIPDAIASFPTDIFCLAATGDTLFVLGLCRLNRVVRFYKPLQYLSYKESKLSEDNFKIRCLKFAYAMLAYNHWVACIWYVSACHTDCVNGRWATTSGRNLETSSTFHSYVISLYWTFTTLTSVGYGDIIGPTDTERALSIVVMISGIVFYGLVIGSIAGALANAGKQRARYVEKLSAIKGFMKDQKLDSNLQKRVSNYYEYIWRRNKGVNTRTLFEDIPLTFQAEIALSVNQEIIEKVPLFQNTEIGFLRMLSMAIQPLLLLKMEYIVHKGDIGNEMFFIHKGTVDVVSPDGKVVFASMHAGSFFGEISLIFSVPRTASIRTATNCDLFVLSKNDLDAVLRFYPKIEKQINDEAAIRFAAAQKRNENDKKSSVAPPSKKQEEQLKDKAIKEEDEKDATNSNSSTVINGNDQDCQSAEEQEKTEEKDSGSEIDQEEDQIADADKTTSEIKQSEVLQSSHDNVNIDADSSDNVTINLNDTEEQMNNKEIKSEASEQENTLVAEERQAVGAISNVGSSDPFECVPSTVSSRPDSTIVLPNETSQNDTELAKENENIQISQTVSVGSNGTVNASQQYEESVGSIGSNHTHDKRSFDQDEEEEEEQEDEEKEAERKRQEEEEAAAKKKKEEEEAKKKEEEEKNVVEVPASRLSKLWAKVNDYIFDPEAPIVSNLKFAQFCLSYITCFSVAYQAVYSSNDIGLIVFNYLCDVFFIIELLVIIRVGYVDENQQIVRDKKKIRQRYWQNNSIYSIAVFTPLEIFCLSWGSSSQRLQWLAYLRLGKLFRVKNVMSYFTEKQESLGSNEVLAMIMKFSFITGLLTHWVGCIWFLIACQGEHCFVHSWIRQGNSGIGEGQHDDNGKQYTYCIYWAVTTLTTTGYGDITPQNSSEMIYGMVVMALGKLYFGFILGTIASSLANTLSQEVRYKERIESIIEYTRDQGVAEGLQKRIIKYYEYLWMRNRGVDGVDLFNDMPMTLRAEVSLGINAEVISKVPLFENSDEGFMRMLSLVIKPYLYLPKDYIVKKGDIGKEMFIIHRGFVEVVSEAEVGKEPIVFDTMEAGSFFGEVSLMFPIPRTASIRAQGYVDMFVLTKDDLQSVLKHFPEYENQIEDIARERRSKALSRGGSSANVMNRESSTPGNNSTTVIITTSDDDEQN